MMRLLSYGYQAVDADIGEMFLNFPLHQSLRFHSGMDLTPFRSKLRRYFPEHESFLNGKKIAAFWWRTWFGLTASPEQSACHYYHAEEFVRGYQRDKKNPLIWDELKLSLIVQNILILHYQTYTSGILSTDESRVI